IALRSSRISADDGTWSAIPPPSRTYHTAIYDPMHDRMLVLGGDDGRYRNDVWALWLSGGPAWSALSAAGSLPAARVKHAAIYDPVRQRMVMFGGHDGSGYRNDVWALSLSGTPAWNEITPAGSLPS